jgi:DNA-binding response OmpR family regulator
MAKESFSLLISDIVMPGMNGLELLRLVKKNWPLTKAVMMTAYASTDTAVNAIRLGALEYVPKPFTPDELRSTVKEALSGDLVEVRLPEKERDLVPIDVDIPFDRDEVAKATGDAYADMLGPSDRPVVEVKMPEPLENYCDLGNMVCDIFKKLGATCKAGTKSGTCPQLAKKKRKTASAKTKAGDAQVKRLIGIDEPFDYAETLAATGPEYVRNLDSDGFAFIPYEQLKATLAEPIAEAKRPMDADLPFDRKAVAAAAGEAYADRLSRSDMPVVEITSTVPPEHFCEVGDMVCDIFKKLGATCKAGTKSGGCPQKAKKKKARAKASPIDPTRLIGIDMPFDYEEVVNTTGPSYVAHLVYDGVVQMPYEKLKESVQQMTVEAKPPAPVIELKRRLSADSPILIIDDEVAVNNNIRKILAKKGYSVDQATTRDDALEKLTSDAYQLVLLDLKIPGVQGLDLLKAVGDHQPEAKVIVITGYASIETAVECARMGAVAYLPKPFTPAEIRQAAETALQMAA